MQTRSLVLFVAAVVIALLLAGLAVSTGRAANRAADFVIDTHEIISALGRSRSHFNRIVAAHRGFLLSGDPRLRSEVDEIERQLKRELDLLAPLVADNTTQRQRLQQLRALLQPLHQSMAQPSDAAIANATLLPGAQQIQRWLELFDAMSATEQTQLAERQLQERRSRLRSEILIGGLILLLIALLAVAMWRARSDIKARERLLQLTSDMERNDLDQERLRTVIEAAPNAILMVDARGIMVLVNAELERLFGYPRSELLGQPVEMLVPDRVRGHHSKFRDSFLKNAEIRPMGAGRDLFGRRRDGSEIPIEIGLSPLQTADGLFVLAAVTDISLRKRSEAIIAARAVEMATQRFDSTQAAALSLFNSETSRQKILDGALALLAERHPFPVLLFYAHEEIGGVLRLVSEHAAPPGAKRELRMGEGLVGAAAADRNLVVIDQIGESPELVIATGFADFKPAAMLFCPVVYRDRLLGVLALAASDVVVESERSFVERLCSQLAAALHNLQQYEDLQLLADQLRVRGEEIEHKNVQLEVANRMKSEFLANMSHELRTPLNAIIGFADVLAAGVVGEVQDEQREYLLDIHQAGRHLLALINDILDLSKVEAGQIELELEPFDVSQLGVSALSVVKEKAHANRVQLEPRIEAGLGELLLDPRKVKQIIYNLLANAVKFSNEGGRVELALRRVSAAEIAAIPPAAGRRFLLSPAYRCSHYLEIAVIDTGIGIEPADLERLFEPFTQVDSSLARRHTGTGLGLAMVRRLTEKHDGRLMVESQPGTGSRFVVWLPWRPLNASVDGDAEMAAAELSANQSIADGSMPRARVLLVDDDATEPDRSLRRQLELAGCEVIVVAGAAAASELARHELPDAIVVNVQHPHFGGWSELAELKQQPALIGTPVVIVSRGGELPHDFALGAADVLVKPVRPEDLHNALRLAGVGLSGQSTCALVVDDDPRAVSLMTTLLRGAGIQPIPAYSGREALVLARANTPDVIVLDLMMPDMSGLEVVDELRRDAATAEIPIIVVTAKWLSPDECRRLAGAVDHVMQKSVFSELSFIGEVRRMLGRRRSLGRGGKHGG